MEAEKKTVMAHLQVVLDIEGKWPDLADKTLLHVQDFAVGGLAGGMESGKPSVAIRIDLPTGQVVFAETSLALFLTAADALDRVTGGAAQASGHGFGPKPGAPS